MTDSRGKVRTARTTGFGYYRFTDVPAGETYVFTASGKRFSFGENAHLLFTLAFSNDRIITRQVQLIIEPVNLPAMRRKLVE